MKRDIGGGVRLLLLICLAMCLRPAYAAAGLDFGYRIDGPVNLRPTVVFNDGKDTYIQPSGKANTSVDGARQDGPYLRLPGIPESFTVRAGSLALHVEHATSPSAPTSAHASVATVPSYRAPNNVPQTVQAERPYQLDVMAKGTDTSGRGDSSAQKSGMVKAAASSSENQPPIIGGPIAPPPVAAPLIASNAVASSGVAGATAPDPSRRTLSRLATKFGADGIRDGFGGTIQIHFRSRPSPDIQFASADGKHLDWSFDAGSNVMTVSAAQKFVVRDGHSSVSVSREIEDAFHYPADNAAGLERVFSEAGAVYFEVAAGTTKVTVLADGKRLQGQQKGRYYRVAGAQDSFVVDADGFDVTVTRSRIVRFVESEGNAS